MNNPFTPKQQVLRRVGLTHNYKLYKTADVRGMELMEVKPINITKGDPIVVDDDVSGNEDHHSNESELVDDDIVNIVKEEQHAHLPQHRRQPEPAVITIDDEEEQFKPSFSIHQDDIGEVEAVPPVADELNDGTFILDDNGEVIGYDLSGIHEDEETDNKGMYNMLDEQIRRYSSGGTSK